MKKMYCTKCGQPVNTKCGFIPKQCTCGADFSEWEKDTVQKTASYIAALLLLMLPLFTVLYFIRRILRDSVVLYVVTLVAFIIYFRQAESILIRTGILNVKNIERR